MTKFNISRHVPYTADQVFAVIADVQHYGEFVPLVKRAVISNRKETGEAAWEFDAALHIAYAKLGITETLTSHIVANRAERSVTATSSEGLVTHLRTVWQVVPAPGGCEVRLMIDYALRSKPLQFVLSGMFDMMVRKVMAAFEERARKLYAVSTAVPTT